MSSNSPSLPAQPAPEDRSSRAYAYVVVSVGDMEEALGLWVGRFGMEVLRRKTGDDPGLARVWGLPKGAIEDQALLNTPGLLDGGLHLVKFEAPGAPVREGAAPTDLVPKSIDVAVREIEARYAEMTALGYRFRSEVHELEAKGMKFHEVHMAGPEGLNLVLLEIPSEPYVVSPQGYGVAPQIVLTTADNAREVAFFEKLLGLERLSHNRLSGPEIERAVSLPPGAVLDITILGARESRFGRLELVQYEGVQSRNLYPRAVPPARGMLSVTYVAPDLAPILERGRSLGIRDHGVVESILGKGRMASVWSPAGLRVDVIEQ